MWLYRVCIVIRTDNNKKCVLTGLTKNKQGFAQQKHRVLKEKGALPEIILVYRNER